MSPVRVLLGALPALQRNALTEAIRHHVDIEVVGVEIRPTALLVAAGTSGADVVVVRANGSEPPAIVSHLLDQYPRIAVLAVPADGRQAVLYALRLYVERIPTPSLDDLVGVIREAVDGKPEREPDR